MKINKTLDQEIWSLSKCKKEIYDEAIEEIASSKLKEGTLFLFSSHFQANVLVKNYRAIRCL